MFDLCLFNTITFLTRQGLILTMPINVEDDIEKIVKDCESLGGYMSTIVFN